MIEDQIIHLGMIGRRWLVVSRSVAGCRLAHGHGRMPSAALDHHPNH
jgi:hypothetical protein